jgi:hypothetical protein
VTSDTGIVCNGAATRPACPTKTLDTTAANKNCVTNLSDTGTGTGTATSSGTAVTGSGTAFTTQVSVGDTLTSASTGTCVVQAIGSATGITCVGTPSPVFAGAFTVTRAASSLFPTYIAQIPTDPTGGTPTAGNLAIGATNSGYYLQRTNGNRLEVGACYPEQTAAISVKR